MRKRALTPLRHRIEAGDPSIHRRRRHPETGQVGPLTAEALQRRRKSLESDLGPRKLLQFLRARLARRLITRKGQLVIVTMSGAPLRTENASSKDDAAPWPNVASIACAASPSSVARPFVHVAAGAPTNCPHPKTSPGALSNVCTFSPIREKPASISSLLLGTDHDSSSQRSWERTATMFTKRPCRTK